MHPLPLSGEEPDGIEGHNNATDGVLFLALRDRDHTPLPAPLGDSRRQQIPELRQLAIYTDVLLPGVVHQTDDVESVAGYVYTMSSLATASVRGRAGNIPNRSN